MTVSFERRSAFRGQVALAALLFSAALSPTVSFSQALPSEGIVVSGGAAISSGAGRLDVNQTTPTAIISWETFSVGLGGHAHFENGNGATLNRVRGNVASQINGRLTATGSLYLINPNGVAVGQAGVVETGGSFVATTLDLSDEEFLKAAAGESYTLTGNSSAEIVNAGKIGSLGGDVVLAARTVENHGDIEAQSGAVGLLAGDEVLIKDRNSHDGRFLVKTRNADARVTNTGNIKTVEAELRANGGNVYALAGNRGGIITATGSATRNGRIFLVADETGVDRGRVEVTGTLNARQPSMRPGAAFDGGQIRVQGRSVRISGQLNAHGSVAAANPELLPPPRPGNPLINGDGGTIKVSARWSESDFPGAIFNVTGVEPGSYHLALEGRPPGTTLPDLDPPPHEEAEAPPPPAEDPPPAERPVRPPIIVPPVEPPPAEEPVPPPAEEPAAVEPPAPVDEPGPVEEPAAVEPPPAPVEEPAPAAPPPAKDTAPAAEAPAPTPRPAPEQTAPAADKAQDRAEDRIEDRVEKPSTAAAIPAPTRPSTAAVKDAETVTAERDAAQQTTQASPAGTAGPVSRPAASPATAVLARGECGAATPRGADLTTNDAAVLQTICNVDLQHTVRHQQGQ